MEVEFLPIGYVANYHEVKESSIKSLFYKNYNGKSLKFKVANDGKLLVNLDYKYPLANRVDELRQIALETAKTEYQLCKELSKITGKKIDTIQRYFIRFTFKQVDKADEIIKALETYISRNSLFGFGV